jgi:hypothetical protein
MCVKYALPVFWFAGLLPRTVVIRAAADVGNTILRPSVLETTVLPVR